MRFLDTCKMYCFVGVVGVLAVAGGCDQEVETLDADGRDAMPGSDAASFDATARDAGGACGLAADCDDGVACNGAETCSPAHPDADPRGCAPGAETCTAGTRCDAAVDACVDCDADGDGSDDVSCGGDDCDDDDANRFAGAAEVCDADHDEDCDPATVGSTDGDADGYVSSGCCNLDPEGVDACGDDCDDARADVHPTLAEVCNGRDDDCDGTLDESVLVTLYADGDGDGHGDAAAASSACPGAPGLVASSDDCDDTDGAVHPDATEECDGADDDCDGVPDDGADPSCSLPFAIAMCSDGACDVASCLSGRGDCDDDPSNGCEQETDTSMAHCGACRTACALANANETCVGGGCVITTCTSGFDDCDDVASNGCEQPLTTLGDCAACNTSCMQPHATATCAAGSCQVEACDAGYDDCAGGDGCETSVTTTDNCGGCGVPCAIANATETCATGTCQRLTCDTGFGDCSGGADCETSLRTNSNCAGCGTACPPSGANWQATTSCSTGACAVADCDSGYCDNSGSVAGCETNIDTDPACPAMRPTVVLDVSGDTGGGSSTDSYGPFIGERWFSAVIRENNTSSSSCEDLVVTFTIDQGPAPVDVLYTGNVYCVNCGSTPTYFSHLNALTVTLPDVCINGVADPDQDRFVWIEVEMATSLRTGCGGWTVRAVGDCPTCGGASGDTHTCN